MPEVWSACSCVNNTESKSIILLLAKCDLISGEVSIKIETLFIKKCAEHLVLIFFLLFLLQRPQLPVIQGEPI